MTQDDEYILEILLETSLVAQWRPERDCVERKEGRTVYVPFFPRVAISNNVTRALTTHAVMDIVDLSSLSVRGEVTGITPGKVAKPFRVIASIESVTGLMIAVGDPLNFDTFDSLHHMLQRDLEFVCTTPEAIGTTYREYSPPVDAPIIKMVSMMLIEAHKMRASDIHLEPLEKRFRIEGVSHEMQNPPQKLQTAIISRLKIVTGSMSIAEKRLPQDGRIQVNPGTKELIKLPTVPTNHGESAVMRILDKLAGAAGSGKTTTLQGCLNYINNPDKKLITVEDPVEYQLAGIDQVQVRADIEIIFLTAHQSLIRQKPNVIKVGEMRDLETAHIAINASLTGHLVISNDHPEDVPVSVAPLIATGLHLSPAHSTDRATLGRSGAFKVRGRSRCASSRKSYCSTPSSTHARLLITRFDHTRSII